MGGVAVEGVGLGGEVGVGEALAEVGEEGRAEAAGAAAVGEVHEVACGEGHQRGEAGDGGDFGVAFEEGELAAGAVFELGVEFGEPAEAVGPVAGAFGGGAVVAEAFEEAGEAGGGEGEHAGDEGVVLLDG